MVSGRIERGNPTSGKLWDLSTNTNLTYGSRQRAVEGARKVEGPTVKERVGSDERETGRWSDRGEGRGGCRGGTSRNHAGGRRAKTR
jgi:hypothetical protein